MQRQQIKSSIRLKANTGSTGSSCGAVDEVRQVPSTLLSGPVKALQFLKNFVQDELDLKQEFCH